MTLKDYLNNIAEEKSLSLDRVLITVFEVGAEENEILYKGIADWCWVDGVVSHAEQTEGYGVLPEWHIWVEK